LAELQNHYQGGIMENPDQQRISYHSKESGKTSGKKRIKKRTARKAIWFAAALMLFFSAYLITTLYKLQVIEFDQHTEAATASHYRKIVDFPVRGSIFDRNGRALAQSSIVETIGITPDDVKSSKNSKMTEEEIAEGIATSLNLDPSEVLAKIIQKDETWILLKKRVEKEEADALKAFLNEFEIGGVSFDEEDKRYYPMGSLASTVIGFTNTGGIGQLGLEYQYNSEMTGEPGYTYAETDNYGQAALPYSIPISLQAENGLNVISTIDVEIQQIIETELNNSIETYDVAEGGIAIVMDPYTGSILGMASSPEFDLNDPTAMPAGVDSSTWVTGSEESILYLSKNVWRNRAISDTYEPGSTFKAITAAMAMEEGKFFENEILSDDDITVADRIIGCSIKGGHGLETTEKGFWNSCNPIFVQLAQRVGLSPFYNYVRGFGLMNKTGIDLPGEGIGLFHAVPSELDMSCLSFGEQSTVTPLAMITSYCAFANGGYLMQPRAVSSLTDSDGNVVKEYSPETVRRVVSEETATRIRSLLKGVVLYGTGKNGYVEGYSVGGKTSTSTREDGKNNISFLSMAPVDQPEICILVILFAPSAEYSKSSLAALTSAKMTSRILEYLDVDRSYTSTDISTIMKQSVIPDLTGKTFKQAQTMLQTLGFNIDDPSGVMGDETVISYQWPAKDLYLHKGGTVAVYSLAEPDEPRAIVPNILGKNVNECMRAMTESGINIIIEGDCLGTAISQEIQPGEMVLQRSVMKVVFSTQELEEGTDLTPATTPAAAS
jgi:stage V sporulation protein D (sporulation-specific penicillin-binding protein)